MTICLCLMINCSLSTAGEFSYTRSQIKDVQQATRLNATKRLPLVAMLLHLLGDVYDLKMLISVPCLPYCPRRTEKTTGKIDVKYRYR